MDKNKTIGYIRISTDKQDLKKQKHLLLEHSQKAQILINEFIEIEMSSTQTKKKRRVEELMQKLNPGDTLIVAELSRLGRNMLETLNIINSLAENNITIIFVRQPELSTVGLHSKLLLAIYSYFAEAERDYISTRTRQGLAAAKAQGKLLGRPKGSKNKKGGVLDDYKIQIEQFLVLKLSISSIMKMINKQLDKPLSYNSYKYYINKM
ncbi:MAG: hypothetical protein A3K10_16600 [Bacteroidetes bacterium RIFCSPLOWO2_12_FULL_31_6]|nr:MAG: hypothetical protein A3K10_16600 [Bacteroidetes bacterium RIFCSPLOWO2_12_FULL_31_6]